MTIRQLSITVTRYAEPNWLLFEALESLSAQVGVTATVLMLDQQKNPAAQNYCKTLSNDNIQFEYQVIDAKSLSFARNVAIKLCTTDLLLYLDTDAIAKQNWAVNLATALEEPDVAIAGGKIIPKWHKKQSFIQKSKTVLDQYSMLDLGDSDREVHRVVGANFGLNIQRLRHIAGFDENLGRRDGKLYSGEETKLCADASQAGFKIKYCAQAIVEHQVLPERMKFRWIATRMYYQGLSSASRGGAPNPSNQGKYTIWDCLALSVLAPFYIWGYFEGKKKANSRGGPK